MLIRPIFCLNTAPASLQIDFVVQSTSSSVSDRTIHKMDDALLLLVYVLLTIAIGWKLLNRRQNRIVIPFPGPHGVPLIGNVLALKGKDIRQVLLDWSVQYGDTFKFSVFGENFLVLSSYEAMKEALVRRGKQFGGRPKNSYR